MAGSFVCTNDLTWRHGVGLRLMRFGLWMTVGGHHRTHADREPVGRTLRPLCGIRTRRHDKIACCSPEVDRRSEHWALTDRFDASLDAIAASRRRIEDIESGGRQKLGWFEGALAYPLKVQLTHASTPSGCRLGRVWSADAARPLAMTRSSGGRQRGGSTDYITEHNKQRAYIEGPDIYLSRIPKNCVFAKTIGCAARPRQTLFLRIMGNQGGNQRAAST